MKTARILSRSIATFFALAPLVARAASDTLNGTSWQTTSQWSLGHFPGVTENAIIAVGSLTPSIVNVNPSFVTSKEIQDITFNGIGMITLNNNSSSTDMLFTLNGGRGAGVPIISSVGDFSYVMLAQNTAVTPRKLGLQLKMGRASGDISVAANTGANALTINSAISETGGAQGINKTGAGRLILGGANTYTGGTTVTAGILEATANGALGTGATVVNGGTLEINLASATLTASSVTVNAGGQIATRGTTTLNSAVTLNGGTLTTRSGDGGTFGAVNVSSGSAVSLRDYTTPANSQSITISGLLSGSGGLVITGADPQTNGTGKALILKNTANTYSGAFNIGASQILTSAPAAAGNTLGTGSIALNGGTLQLRDNGAGSNGTLTYGNNVTVSTAAGTIDVDRVSANTGNTVSLGTLAIGAQTLNVTGANSYGVRFAGATTLSGAATFNPTTAKLTLGGAVGGAFDLNKTGAGVLQLSATNTYSGQTNVNAGTLALTGSIPNTTRIDVKAGATFDVTAAAGGFTLGGAQTLSGAGTVTGTATIGNGGTIQPGNASGTGTLTVGGLTFGANANINLTNSTTPGSITVTGANSLIANAGASVAINLPAVALANGTYVLIDYSGSIGGTAGFGAFHLGALPNRFVASLVNNPANTSIDLTVSGADSVVWKGTQSSEWSTNTIAPGKNWGLLSNIASGTDFLVNDAVIFNDAATNTTVNVSVADVVPLSLNFTNATNNYTITGSKAIAGATGLTKSGAGSVTIGNTNSFTGAVALNGGTVSVASVANSGVNSPLGAGSAVTFNGGTLVFTGASGSTDRTLTVDAGGGTVRTDTLLTLSGAIGGAGALTKTGTGTVVLTGANSYGATNVTSGALQIGDGGASGTLGSGTVNVTTELVFDRSDAGLVVGAAITGTGNVTKAGAGTVIFTGANTYAATTISAGTLQIGNGGTSGTLGTGAVTNDGTLVLNRSDAVLTVANDIGGAGALRNSGAGTVTLGGAGVNTYAGVTTVAAGTLIAGKSAGVTAIPGNLVIESGAAFRIAASNQIDDGATVTINGGTFGDPATIAGPTAGGPIDTVANVVVNGGNFLSNRNLAGMTVSNLLNVTAGTALAQRGGVINAGEVQISGGSVNLDGGSTSGGNESRLNVGAGGLLMTGGAINFNAGPSTVAPNSTGSILSLAGDVISIGTTSLVRVSAVAGPKAVVDLNGAVRVFDVTGTMTIAADVQNGGILKTGAGTLTLNGAGPTYATLTASAGTVNVGGNSPNASVTVDARVNFTVSQILADLTIGNGAIVTVGTPAPSPSEGIGGGAMEGLTAAPVPEPCGTALLFGGLVTLVGLRKKRVKK